MKTDPWTLAGDARLGPGLALDPGQFLRQRCQPEIRAAISEPRATDLCPPLRSDVPLVGHCGHPPASRLPTEPLRARATQHPSPKRQGSISHDTWSTLRGRERKSLCKRTCWPRPICLSLCNPSKTALGSVEREMFERPGPQFSPKPT